MNKVFQALSSDVRRQILSYLSNSDLTAGEIAERFEISKPAVSKHLSVLENAGLVTMSKEGQFVSYSLVESNLINSVYDFLSDFCPTANGLKKESSKKAKAKAKSKKK